MDLSIGAGAAIRSGSVIYLGSKIGDRFETGHSTVIREQNVLGDDVSIWSNTVIDYGCVIGNRVKVHANVYVAQYTILDDDVFIAPGVTILNDPHPGCTFSRQCMRGPHVGRGARIGGGSVIMPMIRIGPGALIGGGSVVTRNVPAGAVVWGSPARAHGKKERLRCWTGHTTHPYPSRVDRKR